MKKQILTSIVVAASALAINSSAFASQDCALGTKDLDSVPALQSLLNDFGGIDQIEGYWKLGGLPGKIQPTTIHFMTSATQFSDQVAEKKNGDMQLDTTDIIKLCVDSSEPDVLHVIPLKASDPANALIQIKPNGDDKISLRNQKNGYHGFNRTDGFPQMGKNQQ